MIDLIVLFLITVTYILWIVIGGRLCSNYYDC